VAPTRSPSGGRHHSPCFWRTAAPTKAPRPTSSQTWPSQCGSRNANTLTLVKGLYNSNIFKLAACTLLVALLTADSQRSAGGDRGCLEPPGLRVLYGKLDIKLSPANSCCRKWLVCVAPSNPVPWWVPCPVLCVCVGGCVISMPVLSTTFLVAMWATPAPLCRVCE
jgi:hypothetical protein